MIDVNGFKDWFARRATLKSVDIRQLREQRMDLDNEARQWQRKLDLLEEEKDNLVAAYAVAKQQGRKNHIRFMARQFEELKGQIQYTESRHIRLIKDMRILLGLERIKENEVSLNARGRASVFNMDIDRLQEYVETASARGELDMEKLDNLLYTLEDADARAREAVDASTETALRELDALVEERVAVQPEAGETAAIEAELARMENVIAQAEQTALPTWELKVKP